MRVDDDLNAVNFGYCARKNFCQSVFLFFTLELIFYPTIRIHYVKGKITKYQVEFNNLDCLHYAQ